MKSYDSIVIGAGQAGLAAAYYLHKKGLKYLVLEDSNQTAGSWTKYYNSLRLFSPARYSSLPGFKFPGNPNRYPTRDEVISYLNQYANHYNLNIRTEEKVIEVRKEGSSFVISTEKENVYYSKTVISATGAFSCPNIPKIDGSEIYKGKIIHSSQYKNAVTQLFKLPMNYQKSQTYQSPLEILFHLNPKEFLERTFTFG
jgi:putative flavoprotein involved in K+ transport